MIEQVANHLWQSTLFAAGVGVLTVSFGSSRAQVRYWLWLAAAIKFLVPFAVLMAIGEQLWPPRATPPPSRHVFAVIEAMSEPFSRALVHGSLAPAPPETSASALLGWMALIVWAAGVLAIGVTWIRRWRHVAASIRAASAVEPGRERNALRRLESRLGVRGPLPMASVASCAEPGVFGIVRPVIVWPKFLGESLDAAQLDAILTHELCHVRRRDNLAALLQMIVQAIFWFHPLVWFLGLRLLDERERACDEDVVRLGSDAEAYAEGILKTCRYAVGRPIAFVATVSGSDLQRRIETIMRREIGAPLAPAGRILLAASVVATILGPVAAGAYYMPSRPIPPQSVVSSSPAWELTQRQVPWTLGAHGEYQHPRTGVTFSVPPGWTIHGTFPSSDRGDQLQMTGNHPAVRAFVWMTREVINPADIPLWLDDAPDQKEEQRRGAYSISESADYTIQKDSVHRLLIGGRQAVVAVGRYTDTRTQRAMAEYMTWIYTEKSRVFFSARLAADELELIRPLLDGMVHSAIVP